MFIICFDLETSGLPQQPKYNHYYNYKQTKYYDNSRVVQIGYTMHSYDESGNCTLITSVEYIIIPRGFAITNERFHGITNEIALATGIEFKDAITLMMKDIKKSSLTVAHNAGFDVNVLLREMWRCGLTDATHEFSSIPYFCTSLRMKPIMKLPMKYKYKSKSKKAKTQYKQPNLAELHTWLFRCEIDNSENKRHTALFDAQILSKCFFKILHDKLFTVAPC